MEQGILAGLAAYRWAAWAWMGAVLLLSRDELVNAPLAYVLVAIALVITSAATVGSRGPRKDIRPQLVVAEVVCGAALVAADGWVYGGGHAFSVAQSLGVAWPLAGVLSAGVAGGPWAGFAAGVVMGTARFVAVWANGVRSLDDAHVLSLLTTAVLFVSAGSVAGHVARLLRRAEREISAARAREEVARTLARRRPADADGDRAPRGRSAARAPRPRAGCEPPPLHRGTARHGRSRPRRRACVPRAFATSSPSADASRS